MVYWVQKVTHHKGQTRVTIPKPLAESTGLDKADVVVIHGSDRKLITLEEYQGERPKKTGIQRDKAGPD